MTSDAQIKAFIDRILRLKEEQDTIGEDIRDIYAEAKSMGFDKTAMGNVVAHLRKVAKKGHDTVAEQGAIFDMYLAAYEGNGSHAPAPARARENIEEFPKSDGGAVAAVKVNDRLANAAGVEPPPSEPFDPETGEVLGDVDPKLVQTIVAGVQTEIGRKALITAIDVMIEREEAEERRSDAGLNIVTKHTEIASSATVAGDEIPSVDGGLSTAGANAGGEDVDRSAKRAVPETDTAAGGVESREVDNVKIDASGPDEKQRATHSPEEAPNSLTKTEEEAEATGAATVDTANRADEESDRQRASGAGPADGRQHGGGDPLAAAGDHAPNSTEDVRGVVYEAAPRTPMKSLNYANCFPELSRAAYERLAADIAERGVQQPIVRMGDVIVDGWSRYNVCRTIGMEYPVVSYSGNDVLLDVIAWQREARQFTPAQERQIAARLAKEIPHRAADIMAAFEIAEELA